MASLPEGEHPEDSLWVDIDLDWVRLTNFVFEVQWVSDYIQL